MLALRVDPTPAVPVAKRLTAKQAAAQLGCSTMTLSRRAARGLVSQVRDSGRSGPNARIYYLPDEIAALAVGEKAAQELMARKKNKRNGPK